MEAMVSLRHFLLRQMFNLWYTFNPPWDTGVSPPELLAHLEHNPPGRALDLGCGTGTNVITMARHGWQAVGVDFAPRAIRQAQRKARQAGVQAAFYVQDVTRLDGIEGPFDLILDMGCYHNLSDDESQAYREQVRRLLAPGGTYLLYVMLRSPGSRLGVSDASLQAFKSFLSLVERQDGTNRGRQPSAWLKFTCISS